MQVRLPSSAAHGDSIELFDSTRVRGAAGLRPRARNASADEFLQYLDVLRRNARKLLLLGVAAGLLAGAALCAMPSVYRATVMILVESGKSRVLAVDEVREVAESRERYHAQVEIIQSRSVAEAAVRALKLWEAPGFDPLGGLGGAVRGALAAVGLADGNGWTEDELVEAATETLIKRIKVEALRLSQAVRLGVETTDPVLSARIANELAAQYIAVDRRGRLEMAADVNHLLQERLVSLREQLSRSERALQDYREKTGLVVLGGSSQTLSTQELAGVNDRLASARARRAELQGLFSQVDGLPPAQYANVPAVQRDPAVNDAQARLNLLRSRLGEARQRYGSRHVSVVELNAQVGLVGDQLREQRRAVVEGIVKDFAAAVATEQDLERQLADSRARAGTVNREEFQLVELEREVDANRELYDMFVKRGKETSVAAEVQPAIARVIDPALPLKQPVGPKRLQGALLAMVLAMSTGAFLLLVRTSLRKTLGGPEEAESRLDLPVLCALPDLGPNTALAPDTLILDRPESAFAEAVRTARTAVLVSTVDEQQKTLLVTSALRDEGKTTVAISLALAHAMIRRTLLIDADLRRPEVGRRLGLAPNAPGLTQVLAGTGGDGLHRIAGSELVVMPFGELPPNPQELLLSRRFRDLMRSLKTQFDVIVVDTPPVEEVSDALILAPYASGTVFVCKADTTPFPVIEKGVDRFRRSGAAVLGTILNRVDFSSLRQGGYTGGGAINPAPTGAPLLDSTFR